VSLKLILEHEVIVLALARIFNHDNERPDFQILRDLVMFTVVVEIRVNIDSIIDQKTKL